jgi:hypothetical protein
VPECQIPSKRSENIRAPLREVFLVKINSHIKNNIKVGLTERLIQDLDA